MSEYTEEVEKTDPKYLCSNCVGEIFLRAQIKADGVMAVCSYCEEEDKCYLISEMANCIETAFESHYQLTAAEPTSLQYRMQNDPDSTYEWEREGQPVLEAIQDAASIDGEPAQDILSLLSERHYDRGLAEIGETSRFDEDDHYEEKDTNDIEFHASWSSFEDSLRTETRFFSTNARAVLDEVFAEVKDHKVHDGSSVIVEAGPGKNISSLFRGRVFQSIKKLEEAMTRPDLHIGPPPFEFALPGRMNAHGISMFYGATKTDIALNEVRPPVGSHVLMGEFILRRPIRLLNVEALSAVSVAGSIFDSGYIRRLERAKFLRYVSSRISRVVMPDDQPFEYLITQAIADYLANRGDLGLDGLVYPSAQSAEKGMNVVLFQNHPALS